MTNVVLDIDHGWRHIKTQVGTLKHYGVKIGIQADAGKETDGTDLLDIAVYNEFGTEKIPSRPFMRTMADNCQTKLNVVAEAGVEAIKSGQTAEYLIALIGTWYQDQQKKVIRDWPWAPNAPSTIARKGSDKPLIDTAKMINAIRYEKSAV